MLAKRHLATITARPEDTQASRAGPRGGAAVLGAALSAAIRGVRGRRLSAALQTRARWAEEARYAPPLAALTQRIPDPPRPLTRP